MAKSKQAIINEMSDEILRLKMLGSDYKKFVMKLAFHETGDIDGNILHMALGICSESGEIADAIKKSVGYNELIDLENLEEELGDLLFYLTGMAACFGLTLKDLMISNMKKLKKRYPNGYSNEDALERKDKKK